MSFLVAMGDRIPDVSSEEMVREIQQPPIHANRMYHIVVIVSDYHDGADELDVRDLGLISTNLRQARRVLKDVRACISSYYDQWPELVRWRQASKEPTCKIRIIRETETEVIVYDRY